MSVQICRSRFVAPGAGLAALLLDGGVDRAMPGALAREAYVQGEHLLGTHDPGDAAAAIAHFKRAVQFDPGYAEGWAGLADAWYLSPHPPVEAMPAAEDAVGRALRLAPDSARARSRLADLLLTWHWDSAAAGAEFREALELDPGRAATYHSYAAYLMAVDRQEGAFAMMERAIAIDPLSAVLRGDLAWFYQLGGRHREALAECDLLLELMPENPRAIRCPMRSYLSLGELDRAAQVTDRLLGRTDDEASAPATDRLQGYWEWRSRRIDEALAAGRYVDPVAVAVGHARASLRAPVTRVPGSPRQPSICSRHREPGPFMRIPAPVHGPGMASQAALAPYSASSDKCRRSRCDEHHFSSQSCCLWPACRRTGSKSPCSSVDPRTGNSTF